ncbi:SAM-dependent methyltransferase [Melaminivora suipulveris]|uniref:SAM-dependent methyltransferase n=1 Tax=Melaminivora suipulveris TaxID=2109913 RepID=A0A2R3QAQ5_9BURK|nr:class I SAM-dependent methyltransferase [Melaminivora suipulveris]AVO48856.1 SAM-dependent methyltransferase [Melaminivora suipulveris]
MNQHDIKALFDQQAAGYDAQWAKTQPIRNCLHLLLDAGFAELPADARILCVGVGTGAELAHLAQQNPCWRFTAVEPFGAMLQVCRNLAQRQGFAQRCVLHEGYLDTLAPATPAAGEGDSFDAATCFLVSQFMVDPAVRSGFFRQIGQRLRHGGILASTDLASDVRSPEYEVLLRAWMHTMAAADVSPEAMQRMRKAYATDVAVLAPGRVADIIQAGGFDAPVPFFQAGPIHGWLSRWAGRLAV